jgi:DNA-binding response OmpR family regulator
LRLLPYQVICSSADTLNRARQSVTQAAERLFWVIGKGTAVVAQLNSIRTHRALVVEDNEHVAYTLDFILRRAGYEVIPIANGRDAQAAIENLSPVDVVLLDLMLPYVSGYQIIREIREDVLWQHVPIVVLSGKVLEEDIVKALDLGANDYVTKPFRPEELLARLRRQVADRAISAPGK